jgi:hypothetical protein
MTSMSSHPEQELTQTHQGDTCKINHYFSSALLITEMWQTPYAQLNTDEVPKIK